MAGGATSIHAVDSFPTPALIRCHPWASLRGMSCEYCGALMDHGTLMCMACGAERRDGPARSREPARRAAPEAEVAVMGGRTCEVHPGLPIVGECPRCGKAVCFRDAPDAVKDNFTCTDCQGMTAQHKRPPSGAVCAIHPTTSAAFICARCGSFACAGCKSWMAQGYCSKCELGIGVKATRSSRFVANFVDNFFVIFIPAIAIVVAAMVAERPAEGGPEFNPLIFIAAAMGALLPCAAQMWAQVTWGQSIGKRMLGIKVVRANGQPIELWRIILLRNVVVHVVAQMCGLLGLVDALLIYGEEQRCLHDYLADSIVVVAPTGGS